MINYYRFCCRIRIADEYADEVPGGEFLAVENGDVRERHEQFADARLSEFSDWFNETPPLLAHISAVRAGDTRPVRARLVDTATAMANTGRSRQGLEDLARRGKLTKYRYRSGLDRRMTVGWDSLELLLNMK